MNKNKNIYLKIRMTQNEMNQKIRISLIMLFEEDFVHVIDSLDSYKTSLRNLVLIKDYEKIINNEILFESLKNEIDIVIEENNLNEPLIIKNTEKCLIEIKKINKDISNDYNEDINKIFIENYKEIEQIILKKIKDTTGKTPGDNLNIPEFVQDFWKKSYRITLKNAKKQNFNHFQDRFVNRKYESIIETIQNIEFK